MAGMMLARPRGTGRRGILMVIVLIALCVMFILGYFLSSSGSSEYMQTSMVIHGLQANTLALGAFEEARLLVERRLRLKATDKTWRIALLDAARATPAKNYPAGDTWMDLTTDLKHTDALSGIASATGRGELKVWVKFYGLRPLQYDTGGVLNTYACMYHHSAFESVALCARDFVGYYTIVAQARFGNTIRTFSSTHDIKIVGVTPPAPRFALFQWGPSPSEQYSRDDLNTGDGCLYVYPNFAGRVFMRGPYVVNLGSSHCNGTGGNNRNHQIVFPEGGYNDWHKWSLLPPPRDGVSEPKFFSAQDPGRPKSTKKSFKLGLMMNLFASDPGARLVKNQQWWVAAGSKQTFSVMGGPDPVTGKMTFSPCNSVVNNKTPPTDPEVWQDMVEEFNKEIKDEERLPSIDEDGWSVCPEGQLYAGVKMATYKRWTFKILFIKFFGYSVKVNNALQVVQYGAYSEKRRTISGLFSLFDLASIVLSAVTLGTADFATAAGGFAWDMFFQELGQVAMDSFFTNRMLDGFFDQGATVGTLLTAADVVDKFPEGLFPPGMKKYGRAAVAFYPDIDTALSSSGVLNLDGGVFVEKLDYNKALTYKGRGFLAHSGDPSDPPKLTGGIHTADPNQDHLTVVVSHDQNAFDGGCMLEIGANDNRASFCVDHGLRTSGKTYVLGNYVCLFPNKRMLPAGSVIRVTYPTTLAGQNPDNEDWMSIVSSPKLAAFTDSLAIARTGAAVSEPEF